MRFGNSYKKTSVTKGILTERCFLIIINPLLSAIPIKKYVTKGCNEIKTMLQYL